MDPTIPVNNAHGITEEGIAYFEFSDGLAVGETKKLRVNFNFVRRLLHFNLILERNQPDTPKLKTGRVSVSYEYSCVVDDIGVHCFGVNYSGQLNVPDDLSNPFQVSTYQFHVCALDDHGVHCWGDARPGSNAPDFLQNPVQVSVGATQACAIDDLGLHCWGGNDYGELNVPVDLHNPRQVSAGWGST